MSERERDGMEGAGRGEMPGDRHGGGTGERGRDRDVGRGERRGDAAADMPGEGLVGGQSSAAESGAELLDAGDGRSVPRGTDEQPADDDEARLDKTME